MTSNDNLMTTTNPDNYQHVVSYNQICEDYKSNKDSWIQSLKDQGYKAAHPNDGWVDREKNTVQFVYPHFNLCPQIGDKIMLGWHSESNNITAEVISIQEKGITHRYIEYGFIQHELTKVNNY
jgi:hypothetical protein